MRTTPPNMAKNNFPWSSSRKVQNEDSFNLEQVILKQEKIHSDKNDEKSSSLSSSSSTSSRRRRIQAKAVSRIRSVLTAFTINRSLNSGLGSKVIGTLFGYRKGHVHFVFQREHNSTSVFFIELATPITNLVKEMASGLVRIALECDKPEQQQQQQQQVEDHSEEQSSNNKKRIRRNCRLLDEPVWRTFCNGKKCGFATRREIGANEAKILKAVEPISMGAGVLPGFNGSGSGPDGELMYMRAKFERVVGSRDSEAFYMMNPDCNGAPELSIYLLRV